MQHSIRIILVETSCSGNIGAAARAMKTMGLSNLYLVNPRCHPQSFDAIAMAAGGIDVLQNARVVSTLKEALAPCQLVAGTSARTRALSTTLQTPRQWFQTVHTLTSAPLEIGIVFGRESHGLTNEELGLCHVHLQIPTDEDYGILNLAQAVQMIGYEWRLSVVPEISEQSKSHELPNHAALEHCLTRFERVFAEIELLNTENQASLLMPRFRRFFYRACPSLEELNIFQGFLKAIEKKLRLLF